MLFCPFEKGAFSCLVCMSLILTIVKFLVKAFIKI